MSQPEANAAGLSSDLLAYAESVALALARKHCPKHVSEDDVVQEVRLRLLSNPPKHDPAKGASEETLVYLAVQRIVQKYVARECRHSRRFHPADFSERKRTDSTDGQVESSVPAVPPPVAPVVKQEPTDEMLDLIPHEDSRTLCKVAIECDGNVSEAARRLGLSEGTIRYRLKMLAPKLLAAGFNPFPTEDNA